MKITIGQLVIELDEKRLGRDVVALIYVHYQTRTIVTGSSPGETSKATRLPVSR